ncbi:hypothetical protein Aduo_009359 [Ancylostoma duodenale]
MRLHDDQSSLETSAEFEDAYMDSVVISGHQERYRCWDSRYGLECFASLGVDHIRKLSAIYANAWRGRELARVIDFANIGSNPHHRLKYDDVRRVEEQIKLEVEFEEMIYCAGCKAELTTHNDICVNDGCRLAGGQTWIISAKILDFDRHSRIKKIDTLLISTISCGTAPDEDIFAKALNRSSTFGSIISVTENLVDYLHNCQEGVIKMILSGVMTSHHGCDGVFLKNPVEAVEWRFEFRALRNVGCSRFLEFRIRIHNFGNRECGGLPSQLPGGVIKMPLSAMYDNNQPSPSHLSGVDNGHIAEMLSTARMPTCAGNVIRAISDRSVMSGSELELMSTRFAANE